MNELRVEHVSKSFGSKKVLTDINAVFQGGHVYGLAGPNGCGKSVLLKCLCGLLTPTSGKIIWNGKVLSREKFYDAGFGASIEKPDFIDGLSGYENLIYLASFRKVIGKKQILGWMKRFDLYEARNQRVKEYSLGMKQKLAIIQAVMENQNIILLDEVSNSLDEESREKLLQLVKELKDDGRIIIYVNHNKAEVQSVADTVYRLRNGELLLCGTR